MDKISVSKELTTLLGTVHAWQRVLLNQLQQVSTDTQKRVVAKEEKAKIGQEVMQLLALVQR